jgi:hypothetical protein
MDENNNSNHKKTRGFSLKNPKDARKLIQRIVSDIFDEGSQTTNAGKISQLLGCWLKAWELEKTAELEKRIAALEQARESDGR